MANNFGAYKGDFTTDTGLDWKTNIDAYIQYVQARMFDEMLQTQQKQQAKMTELIDAVKAIKLK